MAGDPFKKVHPGDRLEIPAEAWNTLMELAAQAKLGKWEKTETPRAFSQLPCLAAYVKNMTGSDRNVFDVAALRGGLTTANPLEFQKGPLLWAETPQLSDIGRPIAVYVEQIYMYSAFASLGI